jgi:hypothetical protein
MKRRARLNRHLTRTAGVFARVLHRGCSRLGIAQEKRAPERL